MATDVTPGDAQAAAKCFNCLTEIQLLAILAYYSGVNAGANMANVNDVLATVKCFLCLQPNQLLAIIAYYQSNSTGGAGQIVAYTSGTPANPADTSKPAVAYDPSGGGLPTLGWSVASQTWL